jgi:hypothetical protein
MAAVPGVLLDHVHVHPAHAHAGVVARVVERLIEAPVRGGPAGGLDLPQVGGEILLGVCAVDAIEFPVGIGLAGVEVTDFLSRSPERSW